MSWAVMLRYLRKFPSLIGNCFVIKRLLLLFSTFISAKRHARSQPVMRPSAHMPPRRNQSGNASPRQMLHVIMAKRNVRASSRSRCCILTVSRNVTPVLLLAFSSRFQLISWWFCHYSLYWSLSWGKWHLRGGLSSQDSTSVILSRLKLEKLASVITLFFGILNTAIGKYRNTQISRHILGSIKHFNRPHSHPKMVRYLYLIIAKKRFWKLLIQDFGLNV